MKEKTKTNFIAVWLKNFGAMVPLNILHGTLLLILAPYGLASVGMARVTIDITKNHYYTSIVDYMQTITKCWKQALIAGVVNLVITALLAASILLYHFASGSFTMIGLFASCVALMFFSFMKYYIWIQIVLIKLPLKKIYQNAYYFAVINLKRNIFIGLICLLFYALLVIALLYIPYPILGWGLLLVFGCFFPGFKQLLVQWYVYPFIKEKMIDPYYEKQAAESGSDSTQIANNAE